MVFLPEWFVLIFGRLSSVFVLMDGVEIGNWLMLNWCHGTVLDWFKGILEPSGMDRGNMNLKSSDLNPGLVPGSGLER